MRNNPTIKPGMSDETGLLIADRLNSLTAVMWAEKKPEVPMKDVNFYDYDGTVVYSYTKEEFLEMAELPANPAHARLSAQGSLRRAGTGLSKPRSPMLQNTGLARLASLISLMTAARGCISGLEELRTLQYDSNSIRAPQME